jgi:hypothetical protein
MFALFLASFKLLKEVVLDLLMVIASRDQIMGYLLLIFEGILEQCYYLFDCYFF